MAQERTAGYVQVKRMLQSENRESGGTKNTAKQANEELPDYVVVHDGRTIQYANPASVRLTGIPGNEIPGMSIDSFIAPESRAAGKMAIRKLLADPAVVQPHEIVIQSPDGGRHSCIIRSVPVRFRGSSAILSLLTDITERKQREDALRESDENYRAIYDQSPIAIELYDATGTLAHANPACLNLFGIENMQAIQNFSLFTDPNIDDEQKAKLHQGETIQYQGPFDFEKGKTMDISRRQGIIWLDVLITPLRNSADSITGFLVQIQNVPNRKLMEYEIRSLNRDLEQRVIERTSQLNASLEDKIVLLREVHHRVRNNFQIIISLLNLQSQCIEDEKTQKVFKESQNRIRAIALVHEKLYESSDIAKIDLDNYIRFLGNSLLKFYGIKGKGVIFNTRIQNIHVDINTAIPIGLIVNELVSNSLKFAFHDRRRGEISLAIQRENAILTIVYKDHGIGIPADLDWRNAKSLGLRLVIALVGQLDGTIELDKTGRTMFTIVVKETD
ncbi:MAG: histidine kinase dimerization/phosphoacceptor domain -containing protein [Methanoregula sp.]|nr:histidine kinase dimerization/phosphoacceptor domain -containing protein [Methanoregula sp.]